jgi:hypothetical protein
MTDPHAELANMKADYDFFNHHRGVTDNEDALIGAAESYVHALEAENERLTKVAEDLDALVDRYMEAQQRDQQEIQRLKNGGRP